MVLHAAHINGAEEHSWYNLTVPFVVSGNLKEYEVESEIRSDSVSGTYVLLRFCDSYRSSVPAVRQNLSGHGLTELLKLARNRGARSESIRDLNNQLGDPDPRRSVPA